MNKLKGKAKCLGCQKEEECAVIQDVKVYEQAQNTPFVRPPRGWFVTTMIFQQVVDGVAQLRCQNILFCPRCVELGKVRADAGGNSGEVHEEGDQGSNGQESLPDEALPGEEAEDA